MTDLVNDSFGDQPDTSELAHDDRRTAEDLAFLTGLANTMDAVMARPDWPDVYKAFLDGKATISLNRDRLSVDLTTDTGRSVSIGMYL